MTFVYIISFSHTLFLSLSVLFPPRGKVNHPALDDRDLCTLKDHSLEDQNIISSRRFCHQLILPFQLSSENDVWSCLVVVPKSLFVSKDKFLHSRYICVSCLLFKAGRKDIKNLRFSFMCPKLFDEVNFIDRVVISHERQHFWILDYF